MLSSSTVSVWVWVGQVTTLIRSVSVRGSGCIQGCSAAIAADGRGRIWSFVLKDGDWQLTCFQNPYNGSGGLYPSLILMFTSDIHHSLFLNTI
jgi:hypothetical protein